MVKSMTGYGSAQRSNNNYNLKIEIKAVNGRYLDVKVIAPKTLLFLENTLYNNTKRYIHRGSISIFIGLEYIGDSRPIFNLNNSLLDLYVEMIDNISDDKNLGAEVSVLDLLQYDQDILKIQSPNLEEDQGFIDLFNETFELAIDQLLEMQRAEGYNIKTDILEKLANMSQSLEEIKTYSEDLVSDNVNSLKERIQAILDEQSVELSEDKLINEITFLTDKLSIDEEMIRLKSHIDLMYKELDSDKTSGKKLDFIAQEMIRETNTIGSKSSKVEITNNVIDLKEYIENIREQVQNIE